jgi:hypothetical protein
MKTDIARFIALTACSLVLATPAGQAFEKRVLLHIVENSDELIIANIETGQPNRELLDQDGSAIISAKRHAQFHVERLEVTLDKGTIVLVRRNDNVIAIEVLSDKHRGAVHVRADKTDLPVNIAQELAVTSEKQSFSCLNSDEVRRHFVLMRAVAPVGWARLSDISLQDMLSNEEILRNLKSNSETPAQRKLVQEVFKVTAIRVMIERDRGAFTRS